MIRLRPVVMRVDRPGVAAARHVHLERNQLRRRRVERRPGGRERDADARPALAGLLHHGGEVFEPDRAVGGGPAQPVLRPPVRRVHQVTQPHRARLRTQLLHDDHGVAFDPARAGGQLGELPRGELGRLVIRLELPLELDLGLRLAYSGSP